MAGNKRLVLIGGCGGIGRVLRERTVAEGWQVTILDLRASLERYPPPPGVCSKPIDLKDDDSIAAAFSDIGAIDGLVNLAGYMNPPSTFEETSMAEFDDVIMGNLRGALGVSKAALPLLRQGINPSMVHCVSGLAAHVRGGYGPYGVAKAGMVNMTKTLALEAAPEIRVNAVGPAAVDTAFLRGGTGRSHEDKTPHLDIDAYVAMTPLARMATPEDIVGPIVFLLGPDSAFMTGQVLWINGGGYMP